jgi:iron complex outermembrane receptor protein
MKKVLFFVLLFSVVFVSPVKAEEKKPDDALVTMEEIVVTATRDTQEVRKAPANVTVITAEEIADSGATSIVEVLDKLESVQFRTYSGNSTQAQIDMRGFGGDNPFGKTLILLDGRRLNRSDMASINWMQIPVNTIEKVEIVRGASTVLYGDSAIGGVINIITKKGKGKPAFNASVLGGSYGLHNERIGVSGATDKWTYALTGENNFSFGYRNRSKYSAQGGGVDVGYSANDLLNLSLSVSFNKLDYQMPGALTKEQMEQDRRQYQPAMPLYWMNAHSDDEGSDKYTNINFGIKSFWGSRGRMEINFLYGNKDLQMDMPSWFSYNYSNTDAQTFGVTPRYILENNIFGFHNKVIVGLDYYHEPYSKDIFSDKERTAQLSSADFKRESIGGYIRDEFSLLRNFILSAGYRFEQTSIKGSNVDFADPANDFTNQKNTYDAQAYEAGLTWLLGKHSKIYTKYSTVYRIPFIDEVASFSGFGGSFLTDLKKEKGISMEAGTEFYPMENLKIGLTVFRVDMEDEIEYVYDPLTWTGENRNVGETRHDGAEISFAYLLPNYFRLFGNYTYHKATFENGINRKKEMPLVPKHMANAGLDIYLPFNVTLRTEIKHVGKSFLSGDKDNNTEELNDYTIMNVYAYWKPTLGKMDMTIFAGADNIADVKYSSFGIDYEQYWMPNFYYSMPGITFKGGLSINF